MADKENLDCIDKFKNFLKTISIPELVILTNDLRTFPEDKKYLTAALLEMKNRAMLQKKDSK